MVGRREKAAKHKGIVSCCTSLIPKYKFCCTSQRRPPQCFVSPCGCLIGRRLCEWTIAECLSRQPRREKRGNVRTHSPDHEIFKWIIGCWSIMKIMAITVSRVHRFQSWYSHQPSSPYLCNPSHYVSSTRSKRNDSMDDLRSLGTTDLGMHS